jgi:uncharacterized protein
MHPTPSPNEIAKLFSYLGEGRHDLFFERVADDVHWTVMGTHPLAGIYQSKQDFLNHTVKRLNKLLKEAALLKVRNILAHGDMAAIEMESIATDIRGKPFRNVYCWIVRFREGKIVEVRAYVDSALVQKLIDTCEQP